MRPEKYTMPCSGVGGALKVSGGAMLPACSAVAAALSVCGSLVFPKGELGSSKYVPPPPSVVRNTRIWFTCASLEAVRVTDTLSLFVNTPVLVEGGVGLDTWPVLEFP